MSNTKSIKRATKAAASFIKRAAIYLRVSSEKQAEKVSPKRKRQTAGRWPSGKVTR